MLWFKLCLDQEVYIPLNFLRETILHIPEQLNERGWTGKKRQTSCQNSSLFLNNIFYFENTTPKEKVKSNIVVTALWAE